MSENITPREAIASKKKLLYLLLSARDIEKATASETKAIQTHTIQ